MEFLFVFSISLIGLFFLIFNTFLFNTKQKVRHNVSKVFLRYLLLLSLIEVSCHVVGILKPNSNFFFSHFHFGFQLICLSFLFYRLIANTWIKKAIVLIGITQAICLIGYYITNTEAFWIFNTYEIVSTSFILILYVLCFLFENLSHEHKYFNFSIGLFLYLSCSVAIFLSGNLELVLCEKPYIDIWVFNSLFYIIFQYFVYREYLFVKKNASIVKLV